MAENTVQLNLTARDQASSVIRGVMGSLQGMLGQITMLAGIGVAGLGLGALVKQGIEFNKTMEDSKGGIAGVLLMTREYVDAAGKVVTGQGAMNAAFSEASTIQEKLKKDALGTAASYTELVSAFQSSIGPATAAGVTNLDEIREITVMATQAMAALNIPTAQAAQELRGLFAGDMGPDNRLNQILRVTKEDLAKVAGDAEATTKLFKDRLGPAVSAAAMQTGTLTVRLSNLGDIFDQVMGDATSGLFKELSSLIAEVTAGVEANKGALRDLGDTIGAAYGIVKDVLEDVAGTIGASAKNAGLTWRDTFLGVATVFLGFVETIGAGVKAVTQYLTSPLETIWGMWKTVIFGIISLFSELVAKLKDVPIVGGFFGAWSSNLDALVVSMTTVDEKFANFEKKADANFGDGFLARTKAFLDGYGKAAEEAGTKLEGLGSRAKKAADEATGAATHFGQVWATESAKAAAAFEKFLASFAGFTGDTVGEAIAKIEKEYRDLVGQLGQMMFQAKVPFQRGLEMLEQLARAKGQQITAAIFNGEAAVEDFISIFEAKLTKNDALLGIAAGWDAVFAGIPGAALSAANAVQGVWASMGRAFDDLFFNVITGRLDSLGDIFTGFADQVAGTFTKLVSDMVQRVLAGQQSIADGMKSVKMGESTGWGSMGAGYANGGGVGGAVAGAGLGYGAGSLIGQVGGGQYNQTGGQIGGVIGGAIFGVIGALVGAIIGTLIGALLSSSTLKHAKGSLGAMVGAASWERVPIYAPQPRGGPSGLDDEPYDPGDPIGWRDIGTLQSPTTAFERQGQKIMETQAGMMADLFRLGAQDQSRSLLEAYRKAVKDSLSGANFDINAGSKEDIEERGEWLLTTLLPRIGLSAAFGQKGYLPPGYQDRGGVGNLSYGMPGMDPATGEWMERQLFDPEAPIPKMLAGLGFTQDKIAELAGRISTDDPTKLLEYITGIVGVVVGLRALGEEMGKSFEELKQGWADEASAGPAAALGKQASALAALFDELDLYSGDEQLKKAQEAQAASEQFWQSVVSYLQQLDALAQKLSAGIQGMREKMRAFLNPLSEGAGVTADWSNVEGVWGKLFGAMDASQVETAANEAAAAIERIFNVMAERVTRGKALLDRIGGLLGRLGSLGYDVYSEQKEKTNPLEKWGTDLVAIQRQVQDAARLSGLEQIEAIEGAATAAETLYGNLKGLLAEISTTSASIAKSISAQIWELGVGEMDEQGQAGAITQRIRELQDQLALATSPAEIAAITSEIQGLTNRYVGTFGKDDPKRQEAIDWAREQLERANGLAQETLDRLREEAEAFADGLEEILTGATDLISTNVSDAATIIGQLTHTLGALDTAVQEALRRLGDDALDSLGPLREAMDGAAAIFTGATAAAAESLSEPEAGFTAATERSTARLNTFADALDRATNRLNGVGPGAPPAPQQVQVVQQAPASRTSSAEIVSAVRRHSRQLTPRVA